MTYKFRAECLVDVITWILLCDKAKVTPLTYTIIKDGSFPTSRSSTRLTSRAG